MDYKDITLMDGEELIWACIGPAIINVRAKAFDVKSEVYGSLTPGQRALFMFRVMYGHIGSGTAELLDNLSHLLCREGVWGQISNAFKYFGNNAMADIVGEMEEVFILKQRNGIEAAQLTETINSIDERLFRKMPDTVKLIAGYIKDHPNEFISAED